LKKSINTYFVQLEAQVGVCPVINMATKLGLGRADGDPLREVASLTLGTNEVSPLNVAAAYAAFANRGVYCTPNAITAVTGADGKSMSVPKSLCSRAMSTTTADTLNTMLMGVVDDGTGQAANLDGRETAGKTGTTDDRNAAWFAGYTPNLAAAVWMGGTQGNVKMEKITIGGKYYAKVYGATGPAPIWKDAVTAALAGTPVKNFVTVPLNIPDKGATPPPTTTPTTPPTAGGPPANGNGGNNGGGNGGATTMGTTTGTIGGLPGGITGGATTTGLTTTGLTTDTATGTSEGSGSGSGTTGAQTPLPPIILPSKSSTASPT